MRYRFATADDARAIGEVHVEGWRWGYRDLLPPEELDALDVEERAGKWSEWLGPNAPAGHFVFVAEDDSGISGFISVGPARDADLVGFEGGEAGPMCAEIHALYLAGRASGQGVGRELLLRAEQELRARGVRTVVLWVLETNERARSFYEKHGWIADGAEKRDAHRCGAQPQLRYRRAL